MTDSFRPDTAAQVQDIVAWAVSAEAPIEIVSRATKRAVGRPLQTAHTLDLSGLWGITLYEPEELVCRAGPGTPLAEIEAALAGHRQMLAFEPMDFGPLLGGEAGAGSIAGVFACNLAGPRRIKAGAARDHILGIESVTGRGELVKSGGRVVKNVTGYDLSKLLTGSFGTLAALTQITIKVLPAPETVETVLLTGLDDAAAVRAMALAMNSSHEVSAAAHVPVVHAGAVHGGSDAVTAIRIEGFVPSVAARSAALQELLRLAGPVSTLDAEASKAFWASIRDVEPFVDGNQALWRLSVTPSEAPVIVADIPGGQPVYDWGGGLIWCRSDDGDAIRAAVAAHGGGHATLIRASEEMRRTANVFEPQPAPLAALSARVKESFDPRHILNPGRMYEGV